MNVATMRRVDASLGAILCAALTVWRKTVGRLRRRDPAGRRGVLFLKLAEQGSTVLAFAAIRRAIEQHGPEHVHFLVFEQNRFILDAMGVIPPENVITIRTRSLFGTLRSTMAAVRRMRRLRLDAAVDLEFFARSTAVLAYLSGAARRVGLHAYAGDGPWRGDLLTHRVQYNPHLHTGQSFELLVRALEQPPERLPALAAAATPLAELPRGEFRGSVAESDAVREIVRTVTGRDAPPLVLLNANCSDLLPLRRWADASYVELARRLLDADRELVVAFTGAPDEAPGVDALVARIGSPRCVSFAGRTTLRQLLVLYGLAEVLVTNDSGPAHFASLTGIDVVTLFGPETPKLFGVVSPRSHVHWAQTACSPCVNAYNNRLSRCRDNICMQRILVDDVLATVVAVVSRRLQRPLLPATGQELPLPTGRGAAGPGRRAQ